MRGSQFRIQSLHGIVKTLIGIVHDLLKMITVKPEKATLLIRYITFQLFFASYQPIGMIHDKEWLIVHYLATRVRNKFGVVFK